MHILINFGPLKSGGGHNVGLNFLYSLARSKRAKVRYSFLCAEGSEILQLARESRFEVLCIMPRNPIIRMLKEIFVVNRLLDRAGVDVIYSYFGVGLFSKKIPQVSGSADSNLYFPEVDFWAHYRGWKRWLKWIIDQYRVWGVKRSTAVVFENKAMEERAKQIYGLKHTCFIKPSVNFELKNSEFHLPFETRDGCWVGLFLCGWQPNKNILQMPALAAEFKQRGVDFTFIFTASYNDTDICNKFKALLEQYNVKDRVYLVGSVTKSQLSGLYKQVDFVFLLSLLESFSNNIIESWYFNKPLIVSDQPWARSICADAACYVDRDNVLDIVSKVCSLFDQEKYSEVVERGNEILNSYPDIDSRTNVELDYLEHIGASY